MVQMLSINLDKPISTAVVDGMQSGGAAVGTDASELSETNAMLDQQQEVDSLKQSLKQLVSAIQDGVVELEKLQQQSIMENQQQIGLLAVGIAKKILVKEIEESKYDIKSIIETTLQAAPSRENVTVRLSPVDYAGLNEILKSEPDGKLENITFESDEAIQPAQCILETPKGLVEYFIDDQLQRVVQALGGMN